MDKNHPSPWKLWGFRLCALVVVPVACITLLEVGLRLAGFGYPTTFLLSSSTDAQKILTQNNRFGWRFFGAQMARNPAAISLPQPKTPGTVRIFVFGESAAYGDPQPEFGLPHMLEAMLSLRHPGMRFEVVNAAMTGINSHVILPIARDCARNGDGDIWVVYMGNNEVVGPFGAGTVFGPQSPPLPLIRGSLALKSTRTGQALDAFRQRLQPPPPGKGEWGGMEMFLNQQVSAGDVRMDAVYDHFRRNLADILTAGQRSGAAIVLSTVAVNLRDCAPFASAHRPDLSASDLPTWEHLCRDGIAAQNAGDLRTALACFRDAAHIDDRFAELRFRQAGCALAQGDAAEARSQFAAARDLDTLRFRCDTPLNAIIRQTASQPPTGGRVLFTDAERIFADHSADGVPGDDLFYEHVHLSFAGNYLLARSLASKIETLLPGQSTAVNTATWPSTEDCAKRLAWGDWSRREALGEVLGRLANPPFTGQLNHDAEVGRIRAALLALTPATQPAGLREALRLTNAAIVAAPDDPGLRAQAVTLHVALGEGPLAETDARQAVALVPSDASDWSALGGVLAIKGQFTGAVEAYSHAFELDSQDVWALHHRAQALAKLGRRDEAIRDYRRAVSIKPRFGLGWLGLGLLYEEAGNKTEGADCIEKALANPIRRVDELTIFARFCRSRNRMEDAARFYEDAFKLGASDPLLHFEAGQCYTALERRAEAKRHYAEAVALAPGFMQAHYLLGLELLREGGAAGAAEQFRDAVRLAPDLLEAQLNLGLALSNAGQRDEALAVFEGVLRRSPSNAIALQYAQALRAQPTGR